MLDERTEEPLSVKIIPSPRVTAIHTVAEFENLDNADENYIPTEQHTIKIQNEDGEFYARVHIHVLEAAPAAEISWVEVADDPHRGHGIGRTLHEEAVEYIDDELNVERIYTEVSERLKNANLDTGFQPIESHDENWHVRTNQPS